MVIFIASFILGFAVTIVEPDLQVLAQTVPHINNTVLLVTVGVGVGFFLCVCMIRILTGVRLRWLLIAFYAVVFILAAFSKPDFLGIAWAVPIKSVGGGKILAYLNDGRQDARYTPEFNFSYELIVVIANEGRTDAVMNAARAAGAMGGTVLHGKGTTSPESEKFLGVSIAKEKEVILIVARKEQKADIMRSIMTRAGADTDAGAVVFSVPVSEVAGFGMFDET